jgi:hypothetical protein
MLMGSSRRRAVLHSAAAAGILLWASAIVVAAATLVPVDHYLISYYVVDYSFGFVRRGLAGALVGTVSSEDFFVDALTMRWLVTSTYLASLAALMLALVRKGRSERRIMLALLIPVLPFGVPYAVYSGRPDLFGAAAVIGLSLSLTAVRSPRSATVCCGIYGLLVGVLAFIHEGIAFEFALGAILAILVLAPKLTPRSQRLCAALAVFPGLVSALIVAAFARQDVSEKTCSIVPHAMLENPFESVTTINQFRDNVFGGAPNMIDYHDWVCGWYLTTYDHSIVDGVKEVLAIGVPGLAASFLLGLVVVAVTVGAVQYVSGIPLESLASRVRGQLVLPSLGLVLMVPVFMTGLDWTRWVLVVGFNVVIVLGLFARDAPDIDELPSQRSARWFAPLVLVFALIPMGLVPGGPIG